MRHIKYFYKVYSKYLSGGVWWLLVITIFVAIADGLGISMLLPLLETLNVNGSADGEDNILFQLSESIGILGSLQGILTFIFLVFLGKAALKYAAGYYKSNLYKELYRQLKLRLYDSVLNVDYQYFSKKNTGHFITVMEMHVNRMVRSFDLFINVVTASVMAISYLLVAGVISWQVSAMAMVLGLVIFGFFTILNKYVRRLSQQISEEEKRMNQVAVQALHAFKYIVSTCSYGPIQKQYENSIRRITQLQFKTKLASAFTGSAQELLAVGLLIAMILIEVLLLGQPIGAVFVILLLFYRGVNQMLGLLQNYQDLVALQGYVESVDAEMELLNEHRVSESEFLVPVSGNALNLSFKDVTYRYSDSNTDVIKKLSIEIKPNTTIALVGASGSGKTTLVDLITGLLRPESGQIEVAGTNLNQTNISTWRKKIGYVSQDLTIFDDTVANNISMFQDDVSPDKIEEAAKLASAHEFILELPHGYNSRIGDKGIRLSGGQKQRLFIARELYKQPELLILDEATSALDSQSEQFIKHSIDQLHGKMTVIIIAHRLSTIKDVDFIYVMQKGEIIESGRFEELVDNAESAFNDMVELQNL